MPIRLLLVLMFCLSTVLEGWAQSGVKDKILQLDEQERQAVLKGDTVALFNRLWWPDILINSPGNVSNDLTAVRKRFRAGQIDYSAFTRSVERVHVYGRMAIILGEEKLQPKGVTDNVGKTVTRRFMNVYQQRGKEWRMIARQATIISVE